MKNYIKSDETILPAGSELRSDAKYDSNGYTVPNWYFGQEEAEKYKDLISSKLDRKLISRRIDLADRPGGLAYEADKLGIDKFELLSALEGMMHLGLVEGVDDLTYLVV